MANPFEEEMIGEGIFIRRFFRSTDVDEMKWHRDYEDRIVEPLLETNWQVQFDNQLPIRLQGKIFIPKGVYHRLIKGDGDLQIKLTKL